MGRKIKYENLGPMTNKVRVPDILLTDMEMLFSELDRLAVRRDPSEILSGFCESLSEMEI